jgi:hypothetical protein
MAHPVAFRRAIETARAECSELRLSRDDRAAIERAANANEPAMDADDEALADKKPRRRRHSGFIGLRAR